MFAKINRTFEQDTSGSFSDRLPGSPDALRPPPHEAGKVMVVDDEPDIRFFLEQVLTSEGYVVCPASSVAEAVELADQTNPDLLLLDIRLPDGDGLSICRMLKAQPRIGLTPVILMTGALAANDRIKAIEAGADDFLMKPIDLPEFLARVRSLVRLKRSLDELDSVEAVILSMAETIEARDPYTSGHCERLAMYARTLGHELGLPGDDLSALWRGGYLHDIGKIAVPDAILTKAGPLTDEEFVTMKQHTIVGERLCANLHVLQSVRPIVRSHHERLDGSGYPDGLRGDEVPLLAQIIGIVDVFDALTTTRAYKAALPSDTAFEILSDQVRRGWRDRTLVDLFARTASNIDFPSAGRTGAPV